jgi:hypothetical protein
MRPYSTEVRTLPAGRWWDAVRVPLAVGARALQTLGDESGAVIKDSFGGMLYWLVLPNAADGWSLPQIHVLGPGSHVAIPPLHRTSGPGLHWRVPLAQDRDWTMAPRLHAALTSAAPQAC